MLLYLFIALLLQYILIATPIDQCAPYLNSILTDKFMGVGAHGTVYEGKDPAFGSVAIKISDQKEVDYKEIKIIKELNQYMKKSLSFNGFPLLYDIVPCGPYKLKNDKPIVSVEYNHKTETFYIIMEKLDGLLSNELKKIESLDTFGSYLAQGFYILEKTNKDLGFAHRDLNPGNLMFKKEEPSEDSFYVIEDQNDRPLYLPKQGTDFKHITFIDFGLSEIHAHEFSRNLIHMYDCSGLLLYFLYETSQEFLLNLKSRNEFEYKLLNDLYFQLFKHFNERTWKNLKIEKENFDLIWLKEYISNISNWYQLGAAWNNQLVENYRFLNHEFFHHLFAQRK